MSILSWLGHLIKGFLKLFKSMEPQLREAVSVSSEIVNAIKAIDENEPDPLKLVLSVIPAELRDKFTGNGIEVLYKAGLIDSLGITIEEAIKEAAARIKEIKGSLSHKVKLNNLAIFLADVFADGRIGWDDLIYLPKLFYNHRSELIVEENVDENISGDTPPVIPPKP